MTDKIKTLDIHLEEEPLVLRAPILQDVAHGFSTRRGGVSRGAYSSLNVGRNTGDDDDAVLANHRVLASSMGFPVESLVTPGEQVHGDQVEHVRDRTEAGAFKCDGLVTDRQGLVVGVRTADCVPILLFDADHGAVAAVHAGWRGVAVSIVVRAVERMQRQFGSEPAKLVAGIGPAIGLCCYEVDDETAAQVAGAAPEMPMERTRPGHARIGLAEAVRQQLQRAGLPAWSIEEVGGCTSCQSGLYFSHRRDRGKTGRHLSWIISPGARGGAAR